MKTTLTANRWPRLLAGMTIMCALVATLGGCSSAPIPAPRVLTASVPGAEAQDSVFVSKGQTLAVKLPANTEGGFAWRLTLASESNSFLALDERHTEQDGSMAWDVFTFHVRRTGNTSIDFLYDRSTDTEPPSEKHFMLNVQVTDPRSEMAAAESSN